MLSIDISFVVSQRIRKEQKKDTQRGGSVSKGSAYPLVLLCVFFAVICTCCTPKPNIPTIIWENDKAVSVLLEVTDTVSIYVDGSPYKVLGEWNPPRFVPAIPFERGQTYRTSTGIAFTIPPDTTRRPPILIGSFPSCDTVPSNLLKIYLQFSEPMSEGRSSHFVQLFDDVTGDTIKNAFLDLQPELWNDDGTMLTLWLDPGRIKQDLIPNKKLGVVMNDHSKYRLVVAKGWRAKNGVALEIDYKKSFVTTTRDVKKPDVNSWSVDVKGDTVVVDLKESFDWSLIHSTVSIIHNDEVISISKTITEVGEKKLYLILSERLRSGDYSLTVESRLEDLAGNNLNRLFETDVTTSSKNNYPKEVHIHPIHVR